MFWGIILNSPSHLHFRKLNSLLIASRKLNVINSYKQSDCLLLSCIVAFAWSQSFFNAPFALGFSKRTGNTWRCCIRRSDRRVAVVFKVDVRVVKVAVVVEEVSSSSSSPSCATSSSYSQKGLESESRSCMAVIDCCKAFGVNHSFGKQR